MTLKASKRPLCIGLFVLVSLIICIGLIGSIGGQNMFNSLPTYKIHFDKSVKGLGLGSPIMFRGVRIGQVTAIKLGNQASERGEDAEWPIEVTLEIDPEVLTNNTDCQSKYQEILQFLKGKERVDKWLQVMVGQYHLCAQLQNLSLLTGQLYIEMDIKKDFVPTEHEMNMLKEGYLPTRRSTLETILETFQSSEKEATFQKFSKDMGDFINSGKLKNTLDNIASTMDNINAITTEAKTMVDSLAANSKSSKLTFMAVLAKAFETMDSANKMINELNEKIPGIFDEKEGTIAKLANQTSETLDSVRQLSSKLKSDIDFENGPLSDVLNNANELMAKISLAVDNLSKATTQIQNCLAEDAPERQSLQKALKDIDNAASSIRTLADTINRNPESLLFGK